MLLKSSIEKPAVHECDATKAKWKYNSLATKKNDVTKKNPVIIIYKHCYINKPLTAIFV